jgi:hypothetical protein
MYVVHIRAHNDNIDDVLGAIGRDGVLDQLQSHHVVRPYSKHWMRLSNQLLIQGTQILHFLGGQV